MTTAGSISELDAASLSGYGALDPASGTEVETLAADLGHLVHRGTALLRERAQILSASPQRLAGRRLWG